MHDIVLTDGSVLEVKINFLTIKMIGELGVTKLQKKIKKYPKDEDLKILLASKMIYTVLRSSGKAVTEDEALMLVPMDDEIIECVFKEFEKKMTAFKKKRANKLTPPKK